MKERRPNRGNKGINGIKCDTAIKLLEAKKKRLEAQKRTKESKL